MATDIIIILATLVPVLDTMQMNRRWKIDALRGREKSVANTYQADCMYFHAGSRFFFVDLFGMANSKSALIDSFPLLLHHSNELELWTVIRVLQRL